MYVGFEELVSETCLKRHSSPVAIVKSKLECPRRTHVLGEGNFGAVHLCHRKSKPGALQPTWQRFFWLRCWIGWDAGTKAFLWQFVKEVFLNLNKVFLKKGPLCYWVQWPPISVDVPQNDWSKRLERCWKVVIVLNMVGPPWSHFLCFHHVLPLRSG